MKLGRIWSKTAPDDRHEPTEPAGTDLREAPPEARATIPDGVAEKVQRPRHEMALAESRRRLATNIVPSSGPSRKSEVIARICLYNLDTFQYVSDPHQVQVNRMAGTGSGENYMELQFPALCATYVYCRRGYRQALAGQSFGALLEDAEDVTALYHVRRGGILKEIHRWDDDE